MWWRKPESIAEPLVRFWSELSGTVHPRDKQVLNTYPHTLQLAYPPPPFIGDIRRARVFVLYANGGFDEQRTANEFAEPGSVEAYHRRLRNPMPCDDKTHPFWLNHRMGKWLREGQAAVVNAMAYRSPNISKERENRAIADKLPSVQFHREWLHEHVLPAIGKEDLMVVVHRGRLWKVRSTVEQNELFLVTKNPRSSYLPNCVCEKIEAFLVNVR